MTADQGQSLSLFLTHCDCLCVCYGFGYVLGRKNACVGVPVRLKAAQIYSNRQMYEVDRSFPRQL